MMAKQARMKIDVQEMASPEEVSLCSVVPAWIATNDGGATPTIQHLTLTAISH